jgi:hypothetical protein
MQASLMDAVFGPQFRAGSGDALVELPDHADRKNRSQYVVTPSAYTILPDGNAVLVANAEAAGPDGKADSSHASRGLLNVFILKHNDGKWHVLKRHENVAALGAYGNLGDVSWVELASETPGMAISYGDSGQGHSIGFFSLFDLGSESMEDLTKGITVRSDNDGACGPSTEKCWKVDHTYRMVRSIPAKRYDDLVIDFTGYNAVPKATGIKLTPEQLDKLEDVERVRIPISSKARYAYDGKVYRLVDGSNIVPGI